MIFDKIENLDLYKGLNSKFAVAFDWFKKTDINSLKVEEKVFVQGEDIWAKIDNYDTKDEYKTLYEGHIKYIDIQILLEGNEVMKVALKRGNEVIDMPYDDVKERYKTKQVREEAVLDVKSGQFAIFFPDDLHVTQISPSSKSEKVKRLIIKVKVN